MFWSVATQRTFRQPHLESKEQVPYLPKQLGIKLKELFDQSFQIHIGGIMALKQVQQVIQIWSVRFVNIDFSM